MLRTRFAVAWSPCPQGGHARRFELSARSASKGRIHVAQYMPTAQARGRSPALRVRCTSAFLQSSNHILERVSPKSAKMRATPFRHSWQFFARSVVSGEKVSERTPIDVSAKFGKPPARTGALDGVNVSDGERVFHNDFWPWAILCKAGRDVSDCCDHRSARRVFPGTSSRSVECEGDTDSLPMPVTLHSNSTRQLGRLKSEHWTTPSRN